MKQPVITLLTDFGTSDHYVGAMKGAMLGICPAARLVDITHEIRPYAIPDAAFTLSQTWPYFPAGTVHLIVIDPGVGTARRALAAEADGHFFVAPDNGVLTLVRSAAKSFEAREITADRYFRKPVSRTFHGRDIFAPVAAHIACGALLSDLGPAVPSPVWLPFGRPVETAPGVWNGSVLRIDHYGNIVTNLESATFASVLQAGFRLRIGTRQVHRYYTDYASAPPGEAFVVPGSSGYLEVSVNQQDAASMLGVGTADPLQLRTGAEPRTAESRD